MYGCLEGNALVCSIRCSCCVFSVGGLLPHAKFVMQWCNSFYNSWGLGRSSLYVLLGCKCLHFFLDLLPIIGIGASSFQSLRYPVYPCASSLCIYVCSDLLSCNLVVAVGTWYIAFVTNNCWGSKRLSRPIRCWQSTGLVEYWNGQIQFEISLHISSVGALTLWRCRQQRWRCTGSVPTPRWRCTGSVPTPSAISQIFMQSKWWTLLTSDLVWFI